MSEDRTIGKYQELLLCYRRKEFNNKAIVQVTFDLLPSRFGDVAMWSLRVNISVDCSISESHCILSEFSR